MPSRLHILYNFSREGRALSLYRGIPIMIIAELHFCIWCDISVRISCALSKDNLNVENIQDNYTTIQKETH